VLREENKRIKRNIKRNEEGKGSVELLESWCMCQSISGLHNIKTKKSKL